MTDIEDANHLPAQIVSSVEWFATSLSVLLDCKQNVIESLAGMVYYQISSTFRVQSILQHT